MCKLYALCYVCVLLCVLCVMSRRGWSVCACCSLCCVLGAFLQSACNVLRKRGFASLRMRHAVCRGLHPSLTPQSISSPHSRWPTHKHTDHGAAPTHTAHRHADSIAPFAVRTAHTTHTTHSDKDANIYTLRVSVSVSVCDFWSVSVLYVPCTVPMGGCSVCWVLCILCSHTLLSV